MWQASEKIFKIISFNTIYFRKDVDRFDNHLVIKSNKTCFEKEVVL